MKYGQRAELSRRQFSIGAALFGGAGLFAPWATPLMNTAYATGPDSSIVTGFDPQFALDVPLPLCLAAYSVTDCNNVPLPPGFVQTALIKVDAITAGKKAAKHPEVTQLAFNANIFGLMGRNASTRTAFVAFRGTITFDDVITDLVAIPEPYEPVGGFGYVHSGFQTVYQLVRESVVNNIASAATGCDRILVTGHSLGAALAVLAAPDIFRNMTPNLRPNTITFAGPIAGLCDFAKAFNQAITSCYRVVNFLDLVPYLPPFFYKHVGRAIEVDSGGSIDPLWRHSLFAYKAGLERIIHSNG